jgi:anti-sigma regulatory factor (Ser/Thr protein kinase)
MIPTSTFLIIIIGTMALGYGSFGMMRIFDRIFYESKDDRECTVPNIK